MTECRLAGLAASLGAVLRLLWIQRPDDRRESSKHHPADAHDARPAGSLNPPITRSQCYACCGFKGQTIGEGVLNNIQLMIMMLAQRAPFVPAITRSQCYACCGFKGQTIGDFVKHNPADAHDARPVGSLNPSNHSVAVLRLLWIQSPDDRRESFQHNPADAHDARPAGPLNPSNPSVAVLRLLWIQWPDDRRFYSTQSN